MNKKTTPNRFHSQPQASTLTGLSFMQSLDLCVKVILIIVTISISTLFFIFIENIITQTSFFAIKEISVSGAQKIPRDEILKTAEVDLNDNILSKKLHHIHKKLIAHPWIRDAAVKRKIPSTLIISIKEEVPLAVVRLSDEAQILINIQGEPFAQYPQDAPEPIQDLPVITGINLSRSNLLCSFADPAYSAVLDILKIKTKEKITGITADDHMGVQLEVFRYLENSPGEEPETIIFKMGFSEYQEKFKIIPLIDAYVKENYINQRIGSMDIVNLGNVVIDLHERDSV